MIQHDVRRLDRLISDISDASRLDAELAREDAEPFELSALLKAIVSVASDVRHEGQAGVELRVAPQALDKNAFLTVGHDSRIGQVITNLIDNARSFSPPDRWCASSSTGVAILIEVIVEDEGPGIPSTRSNEFSSASTRTGPARASARTPASASRSRGRSSKRMAARSGPRTVPADAAAEECASTGARFTVRLPAAVTHER